MSAVSESFKNRVQQTGVTNQGLENRQTEEKNSNLDSVNQLLSSLLMVSSRNEFVDTKYQN
jgi:hypothetical protein